LRKEEDHFLTVFFFFGRGAIGNREYHEGKDFILVSRLLGIMQVFVRRIDLSYGFAG
jgi:hypothetical protein